MTENPNPADDVSRIKNRKRTFEELAAKDAARVFFTEISSKVIRDSIPEIVRLKHIIAFMEESIRYYETVCPSCVTGAESADSLYCNACNACLSCMDWKGNTCRTSCRAHSQKEDCSECDGVFCDECVQECGAFGDFYCPSCLEDHAQECRECRPLL